VAAAAAQARPDQTHQGQLLETAVLAQQIPSLTVRSHMRVAAAAVLNLEPTEAAAQAAAAVQGQPVQQTRAAVAALAYLAPRALSDSLVDRESLSSE
jgi:hypothetical protein